MAGVLRLGAGRGTPALWRPPRLSTLPVVVASAVALAAIDVALVLADDLTTSARATALLVPVLAAAVLGGRRAAMAVGLIATFALALVLPPVGSPRVHLADDIVGLALFSVVVVVVVVALVAGRIEVLSNIGHQRRLLLRSVSHDLRTPLSAIAVAASELADNGHVDAAGSPLVELIGSEVDRLDRLVANLLSLNRIEAGALRLDLQPVDLSELAAHVVSRQARLADRTPVVTALADDLTLVRADFPLLEQVVTNLLENAVRHSPPGAAVEVWTETRDRRVLLHVRDHGPGVPEEDRQVIFEPFRTGANAGLSGIGLAICRAVVEAHGGTITVGGSDDGAIFTVGLPR